MNHRTRPVLRILVLSAGFSARLGWPKALTQVRGISLLRRTLHVLQPFAAPWRIIVVVPRAGRRYKMAAAGLPAVFVANPERRSGMASSIRAGMRRAVPSAGTLLLPVDLAELSRRDIDRLIRRWMGCRRKVVARRVGGGAATPLILPHWLYPCANQLCGDRGLREVVRRLPVDAVRLMALASAACDVDTRADLARARRRLRPGPPGA
jgi:molybdenum cofactor cytidylyltransferase